MSEYIELIQEVAVEVQVWEVSCACGEELTFSLTKDRAEDIYVSVGKHICEQGESS